MPGHFHLGPSSGPLQTVTPGLMRAGVLHREENVEEESKEQAHLKETIIHHHIQRERDLHMHTDEVKNEASHHT